MNILSIGTDREILNPESDVRKRLIEYGKIVHEFHVHSVTNSHYVKINVASNVWIYSCKSWFRSFFLLKQIIKEKR